MAAEKNDKSANDEQIIRQLMQEWAEALVKGDQAAIDRITSADWMPGADRLCRNQKPTISESTN